MPRAQIYVDDAPAFVGRAHRQILVAIFIDVAQVGQSESESTVMEEGVKIKKQISS